MNKEQHLRQSGMVGPMISLENDNGTILSVHELLLTIHSKKMLIAQVKMQGISKLGERLSTS